MKKVRHSLCSFHMSHETGHTNTGHVVMEPVLFELQELQYYHHAKVKLRITVFKHCRTSKALKIVRSDTTLQVLEYMPILSYTVKEKLHCYLVEETKSHIIIFTITLFFLLFLFGLCWSSSNSSHWCHCSCSSHKF